MKHKTITTDKATLLVVELHEGGKRIAGISCDITGHFILWDDGGSYHDDNRPHGQFRIDDNPRNKWKLLGRIPDITETQSDWVVEKVVFEDEEFGDIIKYRDYTATPIGKHNKCYAPITALKSLYSLLQDNEVYFDNPLGKLHPIHPAYTGEGITVKEWLEKCKKWQESQTKVWDKERCYIFIKVD